ncbi:MAG: hypothetical protein MSA68_01730 [Helicobacter sp.]|nr:hypothetical protein [Helicobacter sp.]
MKKLACIVFSSSLAISSLVASNADFLSQADRELLFGGGASNINAVLLSYEELEDTKGYAITLGSLATAAGLGAASGAISTGGTPQGAGIGALKGVGMHLWNERDRVKKKVGKVWKRIKKGRWF